MNWRSRRVALGIAILFLATILAVWWAARLLDPGDKQDTTPDVTPATLAPQSAPTREFVVDPSASRVGFVAQVAGVGLEGVFPVRGGTIILEPVAQELQVHVTFQIDVDGLSTSNTLFDRALRAALASGDYPLAFYVAASDGRVPVTEERISFGLTGDLELHNVVQPHPMDVSAQLSGATLEATTSSTLNLERHGVTLPSLLGSPAIDLRAVIVAREEMR